MATYDLDRTELNHLLTPEIDPSVRAAIIDFLFKDGGGGGHDHITAMTAMAMVMAMAMAIIITNKPWRCRSATAPIHRIRDAEVLDLTTPTPIVDTNDYASLKVIVDGDADLDRYRQPERFDCHRHA